MHGVPLDLWHAGLLTPIVLAWRLWRLLGARLGEQAVVFAVYAGAAAVAATLWLGPLVALLVALVAVPWVLNARDGARERVR